MTPAAQQPSRRSAAAAGRLGDDRRRSSQRVVADHLDERPLGGPGLYRRRRDHLSPPSPLRPRVADHRSGCDRVVHAGRNSATLQGFFDRARRSPGVDPGGLDRHERRVPARDPRQPSPRPRSASIPSTSSGSPPAPPTHVRREEWNRHDRSHTPAGTVGQGHPLVAAQGARAPDDRQLATLAEVQAENRRLYRAFLLREELRLLYHLPDPALAPDHLNAWLAWATRSRLKPFVRLARTMRQHRDGILAAIRLGLSNGRLEGLNSKIRLISHRAFGFHSADPLIALVYICCAVITPSTAKSHVGRRGGTPITAATRRAPATECPWCGSAALWAAVAALSLSPRERAP